MLSLILRHGCLQNTGHYTIITSHLKCQGWLDINDLGQTQYYRELNNFFSDIKIIFLQRMSN